MGVAVELIEEARATNDPDRLEELSQHRLTAVRRAVAGNPAAPRAVLVVLVGDRHHLPRYAVAKNKSPVATEVALGADRADVRVILAQRRDLPDDAYERLVNDPSIEVKISLAECTDRRDLIATFARADDKRLRACAAIHPLCCDSDFETLSRDPAYEVRSCVAGMTQRLTPEMRERLMNDRSANVRWHLLTHHRHKRGIAKRLLGDPDQTVAKQAWTQLPE